MWWLQGIEDSLKRIADCLERVTIRSGPYKDHIMMVSRNSVLEDYLYDNPQTVQVGGGVVNPDIQVLVDLPEILHPEWANAYVWEICTTRNDGTLPKQVEYRHNEEHALLLFNQKKKLKGVHVTLDKTCKFRVSEYSN